MKLLALLLCAFLLAGCASSNDAPGNEGTDGADGADGGSAGGNQTDAPAVEVESPCETILLSGIDATIPPRTYVGAQGAAYVVIGTEAQEVYIDDNGITGLQTVESCPDNHDTRLP